MTIDHVRLFLVGILLSSGSALCGKYERIQTAVMVSDDSAHVQCITGLRYYDGYTFNLTSDDGT